MYYHGKFGDAVIPTASLNMAYFKDESSLFSVQSWDAPSCQASQGYFRRSPPVLSFQSPES
jgi:hypothetical protein